MKKSDRYTGLSYEYPQPGYIIVYCIVWSLSGTFCVQYCTVALDTIANIMSHPTQPKRLLSNIPEPKYRSGIAGASINLTNAIVGSGIIGIPFAMRESGMVLGMILLTFVSYLTGKHYCKMSCTSFLVQFAFFSQILFILLQCDRFALL